MWQERRTTVHIYLNNCLMHSLPLLVGNRTMQTAVGAFGGEGSGSGSGDGNPLMAQNTGKSNRPAISSLNSPPFIAVELCREHLGVHPCDRRRSISEYKPMFPAIDFSLIENEGDVLWTPDTREKNEDVAARGVKFMKWLLTREEKEIAVVTHSGFLFHTLAAYGDDCHPTLKKEMSKHMLGSNASKTDFPGKIPSGTDVPSDAV
ncbi:unnamed protein product [Lactuca virosa]|uniref:Phosphoglycerate mutase-like protein n=1 Tax=Lactuca virosa TaxID=75947 RepID=A0AAU9LRH9_9ASTR|nr:unnamed protein product [Lactuca virosa]